MSGMWINFTPHTSFSEHEGHFWEVICNGSRHKHRGVTSATSCAVGTRRLAALREAQSERSGKGRSALVAIILLVGELLWGPTASDVMQAWQSIFIVRDVL